MSDDVYSDDDEFVEEDASLSFIENQPEEVGHDHSYSTDRIQVLSADEQQLDQALSEHGQRITNSSRTIAAALNSPPLSPTANANRSFSPSSSKSHSRLSSSLHRTNSASHRNNLSQQIPSDVFNFDTEFQSMLSLQPPSSSPLKPEVEPYEMQFDEADESDASASDDVFNHPDALQILNSNNESSQHAPVMSRTEKDPVVARLLNRVKRKQKEAATAATSNEESGLQPSHFLQATVGSQLSSSTITALRSHAKNASQTATKLPLFAPEPPRAASVSPAALLARNRLTNLALEWNQHQREFFPDNSEKENHNNLQNASVFDEFPHPTKAAYAAEGQSLSLLVSQLKANAAVMSLHTHQFGQRAQQLPVAKTKFQDIDLSPTPIPVPDANAASDSPGAIPVSQSNLDGLLNHLHRQRMNPPTNEMASNQQQIADELFLQHNSIQHCLQAFRNANASSRY